MDVNILLINKKNKLNDILFTSKLSLFILFSFFIDLDKSIFYPF